MRQMKLLEAIGNVDEDLLLHAEITVQHRPRRALRVMIAAALIAALTLTTVAVSVGFFGKGNTVANIATGQGGFAYGDGYIYYGEFGRICRLDLQTGKVKTFVLEDENTFPMYLFVTQEHIGYVAGYQKLVLMKKDGSSQEVILEGANCSRLFVDGNILYSDDGEAIRRINMENGEVTVLATNTHGYWVDDTYLYALVGNQGNVFLRSRKDVVEFEQIELSFYPTAICVDGEDLYITSASSRPRYQVIHYGEGKETPLPIHSAFVQTLDNDLIYLDAVTQNVVKSYDLITGEVTVLLENVHKFSVLEGRYICFDLYNEPPVILDYETGKYILKNE